MEENYDTVQVPARDDRGAGSSKNIFGFSETELDSDQESPRF